MSDTNLNDSPNLGASTQPKQANPTLKLLSNRTRLGPVSQGKVAKAEISRATGKVLFNNNLQLVVKKDETKPQEEKPTTWKQKIEIPLGIDAGETATKYFMAWDKLHKSEVGTSNYQEKYKAFLTHQKATYLSLGISLTTDTKGKTVKPELTEQQRSIYNKEMKDYSFQYFETRLSFKSPGVKAVRSLTYRSLTPPDLDKTLAQLRAMVNVLDQKISVKRKSSLGV